jgi:parallel beta-helix repeat protein
VVLASACVAALVPWASVALGKTYHVAAGHPKAADQNPGSLDAPWKTISKAADSLEPGDTVLIHEGVYREQVKPAQSGTPSEPITYQAAESEEVVVTGADVVAGWTPVRPGLWKKSPWPHRFPTHPNDEKHRLIGRCEQVILDGRLLRQVERVDAVEPGTFCADSESKVLYLMPPEGVDPNERVVEASVRRVCFGHGWGGPSRDHVRLRGVTVRYAANTAQRGALFARGNGWLVEDCLVEKTNGNGISFRGDDVVLRRVRSRHNGQQGLGGGGHRFLLEDVALEHNNSKGFDKGWEAGGFKIAHARDGVVRRCRAVANDGTGMWFDIDVRNVCVERCLAKDNAGHGIYVEISGAFQIRNNLCVRNGTDDHWGYGGIALGESDHCTVEHNTCVLNPTGISIREQGPRTFRGMAGHDVTYHVHDVTIRHNVCALNRRYQFGLWWDNVFFGPHPSPDRGSKGTPYDPDQQRLRLDHNLYWAEDDQQIALWGCPWRKGHAKYADLAAWQHQRGHDAHSLAADPLFVDPKRDDWSFQPTSPARQIKAGRQ